MPQLSNIRKINYSKKADVSFNASLFMFVLVSTNLGNASINSQEKQHANFQLLICIL